MKTKRTRKLLITLITLIFVLLIQTEYIKSEEKKIEVISPQTQTVEISDKYPKDNKDTSTPKEQIPGVELEKEPEIIPDIEQEAKQEIQVEVEPEKKPEIKQNEKPVEKPAPVITYKEIVQTVAMPFQTETISDASMNQGDSKVEVKGVEGKRKIVTQERYLDGTKESSKELSNSVLTHPVNQVIRQGSKVPSPVIDSDQAKTMFNAMNKSRAEAGKPNLKWSGDLAQAASTRASEIAVSFSHTRPNGQNFHTVAPSIVFGENIASASSNAQETHVLFMNSDGHRSNILDSDFKSVGISVYKKPGGGASYWAVLFNY